ncbi:MAG TPA: hypothetical protein VM324_07335 [Egibacteraceae bacterium]|jgi:hypothetical protein|nr:hypothetical protein [Egibacteraceae bacterium]
MKPERQLSAPLYIPEELQLAYGAEARRQVRDSWAAAVQRDDDGPSRAAPPPRGLRAALVLAMVAWGCLVAVWWGLAQRSGSPVWSAVAVLGAIVFVLATVALPRTLSRACVPAREHAAASLD